MMKSGLNRRDFLKFSAFAGSAALLAACTPAPAGSAPAASGGAAAPAAEAKTLSYWWAWGNFEPAMKTIQEQQQFKDYLAGTTMEFKGNTNEQALLTAIAGGTPPDAGSNYSYPNLFTRGATIAVDAMVEASTIIKKEDMLDTLWRSAFIDGKMIGVPAIESYLWWGLNYNTDAATKAGLDPDTAPVTWADCMEWHKALTKKDAAGNLLQIGLDPYDAMAGETDFAATSWGFTWWDEDTKKFDLGNPLMAESMNVMGDFYRLAGPDQFAGMRQVEGQGTWGASYNAGVQSMIIEGYWHPGETQIQKPEIAKFNRSNWAPVPVGREDHKIMATGAHFVVIFKDGKNAEDAFKLGEYLNTPPALDVIFKEVGWIQGVLSWLKTVDKNTYPGLAFYIDAPEKVTDFIIGRRCPIHPFVQTQYQELREQVYRDLMDPQAAADELQKRAVAEWEAQGLS